MRLGDSLDCWLAGLLDWLAGLKDCSCNPTRMMLEVGGFGGHCWNIFVSLWNICESRWEHSGVTLGAKFHALPIGTISVH